MLFYHHGAVRWRLAVALDNLCAPAEPLTSLSSTQSQLAILLQDSPSPMLASVVPLTVGMSPTVRPASWLPGAVAPSYLDGSLPGDVGFDPFCFVALAPTSASIDSEAWSGTDRKARMIVATEYEKRRKVMWMREAEVRAATRTPTPTMILDQAGTHRTKR